jgi:hypothetical protein
MASLAILGAAHRNEPPGPISVVEDLTGEGIDALLLGDDQEMIVLTPAGGRLLYWLDRERGELLVGNPLALAPAPYVADALLPVPRQLPNVWLPDELAPDYAPPGSRWSDEPPPTRLGRFLPDWIFDGESPPFRLITHSIEEPGIRGLLPAGRRCLLDWITIDDQPPPQADAIMSYRLKGQVAVFWRDLNGVTLTKTITRRSGSVSARYRLENSTTKQRRIRLVIANELTPDYAQAVATGAAALESIESGGRSGVQNTITGATLWLDADREWLEKKWRQGLLSVELEMAFDFVLPAGGMEQLTFTIGHERRPMTEGR